MTPPVRGSAAGASVPDPPPATRYPAYRWLALLPTIGLLGGVPFANRVRPFVLGLPFLLFYVVAWVVATSAIVAVVWSLDRANGLVPSATADDEAAAAAEGAR